MIYSRVILEKFYSNSLPLKIYSKKNKQNSADQQFILNLNSLKKFHNISKVIEAFLVVHSTLCCIENTQWKSATQFPTPET